MRESGVVERLANAAQNEIANVTTLLLGLAIGDALGFPAEFRSRQAILDGFGRDGLTDFVGIQDPRFPPRPVILGRAHPPGTYTDDTQMTLAIAESLVACPGGDLDQLMREVGRRFVLWHQIGRAHV